jgi:hypothetical protein
MPTYAKDTTVAVERSKGEIERTLQRFGASAFMYGWDAGRAVVGFEVSGRRYRITLPLPAKNEFRLTATGRVRSSAAAVEEAWEQACRQRWRALALWIKAVLEAAEAGITSVDEAMQPFVVLPNGETAGRWLAPQIDAAYQTGSMPALLPDGA